MSKRAVNNPHPGAEAMAAFAEDRLSSRERAHLVGHLATCRDCRTVLATFASARAAEGAATPAGAWRRLRARAVWLSLAATLTVATAVGVRMWPAGSNDAGPAAPAAMPSQPGPPSTEPAPAPPDRPPAPAPTPPPGAPEDLSTRRSAVREVAGKTFRLEAGEWIDADYDPLALLPVERVTSESTPVLLERMPELRPYVALGPRVTVVFRGVVYRVGPS